MSASEKGRRKFSRKRLSELFTRSVPREDRLRSASLPDILDTVAAEEEEEPEFWDLDRSIEYSDREGHHLALYQNIDCISLNRYRISESDSEVSEASLRTFQPAESPVIEHQDEVTYAVPDLKQTPEATQLVHHYEETTLVLPVSQPPQNSTFYSDNLDLSSQLYKNSQKDFILPVFSKSEDSVTFKTHINQKEDITKALKQTAKGELIASIKPEKGKICTDKEETAESTNKAAAVTESPHLSSGGSDGESSSEGSSQRLYERPTVAAIRNKLEKIKTKEQIFKRYSPVTRRKPHSKSVMNIVDVKQSDPSANFCNIRAMFENQSTSSKPRPTENMISTPKSSKIMKRNEVESSIGKHLAVNPTTSSPSSNTQLLKPGDSRLIIRQPSSIISDVSSSEDEGGNIVSESEGPESDVEEERDVGVEEEMNKRMEETLEEKNRRKRYKIAEELYMTEQVYYSTLYLIHNTFRNRLKDEVGAYRFPEKTIRAIFLNTQELHDLHMVLRDNLKERIENWNAYPSIGDVMKSIAPYFQLYTDYMAKFETAIKTLNEMCAKNEEFKQIVNTLEADDMECQKLKISQHMLAPVQRIPRYRMLLEQYIERLEETSPDYNNVKDSLEKVALAANKANDNIAKLENFQLVTQLLSNVSGLGSGLEPKNSSSGAPMVYIKHGRIKKMSRREVQDRFIFVFSDVILICKIEGQGKYRCNKKIFLNEIRSVAESNDPNMPFPFELITKKCSFTLGAKDNDERSSWTTALTRLMSGGDKSTSTASPQRLGLVAPVWIPDNGVSMCMNCERSFTAIVRRHHCRACGKVYCSVCSSHKQYLAYDNKVGRICDSCNAILTRRDTTEETRKARGMTGSNFFSDEKEEPATSTEIESQISNSKCTIQSGEISGYILVKLGDKDFQKLWCVVRNVVLHLYAGTYDKKAKKEMPLVGWTIAEPEDFDKIHDTHLVLKVGHLNLDPLFLKFPTETDKERWYEVLTKATFFD